ncbi:MAG: HAD family hydrolase [bacterium]|nr:HAD family hydrolase [bacterium]
MDQRILFFDIDGTLLNRKAVVPESAVKALSELKKKGHLRFVCTGRTRCMVPEEVRVLDFDGFVLGGGTEVEYKGEQLIYTELSSELIERTTPILKKFNFTYLFEGRDHVYYEKEAEQEERAYFSVFVKSLGAIAKVVDQYSEVHASKITLVPPNGFSLSELEEFKQALSKDFTIIVHDPVNNGILTDGLIELVPVGINKATGIANTISCLNISKEATIGVGDSNNDLEMLEFVETAVVMGNGTKRAKELADLITTHIDEDGIWNSMERLQLI